MKVHTGTLEGSVYARRRHSARNLTANNAFFLVPESDVELFQADPDGFGDAALSSPYKARAGMDLTCAGFMCFNVTLPTIQDTEPALTFNESQLEARLGPRRQELYKVIPITVIYCVIFVFGILGNISTCVVIAKNRFMQTATNIYLFNLAVSDLLMLILGLPQETYIYWSAYPYVFGETFCLIRTMAAETSTNASILTITAFTVERYVAICHPMRSQTLSSLRRVIKVIVAIWMLSGICSVPMVVQFGIVYLVDDSGRRIPESATCGIRPRHYLRYAFEISTFLFFFTPMTIITVLYMMIGLAIRRSTLKRKGSNSSQQSENTGSELRAQQQAKARRAVLKMLVAVVVAFFVCWAPFHSQRLMVIYMSRDQWTPKFMEFQEVFYQTSGVLYYVISVVNPILYNVMSLKFRQAFRSTIFTLCRRRANARPKATVLRTYRFRKGRQALDTNVTLVNGNGFAATLRAQKKCHLPEIQYMGPRSQSASHSTGHKPLGYIVGAGNLGKFDVDSSHRKDDSLARHSFHYNPGISLAASHEDRLYHSYA